MRGEKVRLWEMKLKSIFDAIDHELEAEYHGRFALHPSRPKLGSTTNPEDDGLINVGAAFSVGYGTKTGPSYVVEIRLSTLQTVPANLRDEIRAKVIHGLETRLPIYFPTKELRVSEENGILRIHGDLSLTD